MGYLSWSSSSVAIRIDDRIMSVRLDMHRSLLTLHRHDRSMEGAGRPRSPLADTVSPKSKKRQVVE